MNFNVCLVISIALFLNVELYAQKIEPKDVLHARELKSELKEEEIIIENNSSLYEFNLENDGNIFVAQTDQIKYLALSANVHHIQSIYYDDQSEILSYSLKNLKKKSVKHDQYCGHIKSRDIFYSDAKVCAYNLDFNLEGEIMNFKFKKIFKDPRYFTKVFLQKELFVEQGEIKFKIPDLLEVELKEINFDGYPIKEKIEEFDGYKIYSYSIQHMKKLPSEENMPGYLHFVPHILVLTKSYSINGQWKNVLSNTGDLYNWYASLIARMDNDQTKLTTVVDDVLSGGDLSESEKIEALYYWVQNNIRYIAFEDGLAGFKPENAQDVLYNKYGDCKGMANLLKEMLVIAGFDARLTWIGTNRIPYDYSIPSLAVDNHMVCSVMTGDSILVLDATEKFQVIGKNAERIQGRQILIENDEEYIIKTVSKESLKENLEENKLNLKIEDGFLIGQGVKTLYGEKKKQVKYIADAVKSDKVEKFLSYVVSQEEASDYELVNEPLFVRDKPTELSYKVKLKNRVQSLGQESYIDLETSKDFHKNDIKKERISPFDFKGKKHVSSVIQLEMPENMQVKSLPKSLDVSNEFYSMNLNYSEEKGHILYTKEIKIFQSILPKELFEQWNADIKKLNNFYTNQIILVSKP